LNGQKFFVKNAKFGTEKPHPILGKFGGKVEILSITISPVGNRQINGRKSSIMILLAVQTVTADYMNAMISSYSK